MPARGRAVDVWPADRRRAVRGRSGGDLPADRALIENWPGNDWRRAHRRGIRRCDGAGAPGREAGRPGFLCLAPDRGAGRGPPPGARAAAHAVADGHAGRPLEVSVHSGVTPDRRPAGIVWSSRLDGAPTGRAGGASRLSASAGIQIDIHQDQARGRRDQRPDAAVPDPAGRRWCPIRLTNLIAASRTSRYDAHHERLRLSPVEWNIGRAAGALAAFSLGVGRAPRAVARTAVLLEVPAQLARRRRFPLRLSDRCRRSNPSQRCSGT